MTDLAENCQLFIQSLFAVIIKTINYLSVNVVTNIIVFFVISLFPPSCPTVPNSVILAITPYQAVIEMQVMSQLLAIHEVIDPLIIFNDSFVKC